MPLSLSLSSSSRRSLRFRGPFEEEAYFERRNGRGGPLFGGSLSLSPFWCSLAAKGKGGGRKEKSRIVLQGERGETSFFSPSFHAAEAAEEAAFLRTPPGTRTEKGGMEEVSPNRVCLNDFAGHNAGPPYIVVHCIYMFGESSPSLLAGE